MADRQRHRTRNRTDRPSPRNQHGAQPQRRTTTAAASRTNPRARAFVRNLAASADEQTPDSQGRITLSPGHRDYAGLRKECVVTGSVDFLEIWDADAWERYRTEHEEDFSEGDDDVLSAFL